MINIDKDLLTSRNIPPEFLEIFNSDFPKGSNNLEVLYWAREEYPVIGFWLMEHLPFDQETLIFEEELPEEIWHNGNIEIKSADDASSVNRILVRGNVDIKNVKNSLVFDNIRIDASCINADSIVLQNDSYIFVDALSSNSLLLERTTASITRLNLKRDFTLLDSCLFSSATAVCDTLNMNKGCVTGGILDANHINMYNQSKIENRRVDTAKENINLSQESYINSGNYNLRATSETVKKILKEFS